MSNSNRDSFLDIKNVTKKYGDYIALNDVSINIPTQSTYGLLGPNGAGKTTLIRIINQITYPDKGTVLFQQEPLQPKHIAMIGYLPEERGLYKGMKVGEQAMYLAQLKGLTKQDAKAQLKYWFDKLDIGHWWNKKVQELSKGMAQKVQFVVTVLHRPKLLIFDEPFSGFDPINANIIKEEIRYLKEQGATVIFSTHRMESVEELCDHIALINKSQKILDGNLTEIKRAYKNDIYEVGLLCDNHQRIEKEIADKFKIAPADFKTVDNELKLKIYLDKETTPNDLLVFLKDKGSISHFVEIIPSANDIFIETIEKSNCI